MPPFWTVKSPAGCNSFATVMRGVLLAAMAMLVLILPGTAVEASPRQQTDGWSWLESGNQPLQSANGGCAFDHKR